jgi:hypothetical protein
MDVRLGDLLRDLHRRLHGVVMGRPDSLGRRCALTPEARARGGRVSAERRRAKSQSKWPTMTRKAIYESGYTAGYHAALFKRTNRLRHK